MLCPRSVPFVMWRLTCGMHGVYVAPQASGFTALCLAVHDAQFGLVKALVRGRANVNHVDSGGRTPLCLAAAQGRKDVCDALIQGGANASYATAVRWTRWLAGWVRALCLVSIVKSHVLGLCLCRSCFHDDRVV